MRRSTLFPPIHLKSGRVSESLTDLGDLHRLPLALLAVSGEGAQARIPVKSFCCVLAEAVCCNGVGSGALGDQGHLSHLISLFLAFSEVSGGQLPARFLRHFLVMQAEWTRTNVMEIYSAILLSRLNNVPSGSVYARAYANATLEVYEFALRSFMRSPKAPYLTWTWRDVARTFDGILAVLVADKSLETLREAFHHEVSRVFEDKLKMKIHKDLLKQHLRQPGAKSGDGTAESCLLWSWSLQNLL